MSEFIIALVTVGKETEARTIARTLIDESIAACVGIVSQKTIYRWKGKIVDDNEFLLIIKTKQDQFSKLRDTVLSLHSYEVPEIISIEIQEGHTTYLEWIQECVETD
ncbi:MAG: divalent-cation tolerance protein CutA [Promethearchaeota archaeon]